MIVDRATNTPDEKALVARCIAGEEDACSELFHRYYKPLMTICLRYAKDTDAAKDILQDGFVRIFGGLGSYTGTGSFLGWMKRVMVHTAINQYKATHHDRSNVRIEEAGVEGSVLHDIANEDVFARMGLNELLGLVQDLSPTYRTVFNLRVMEGWTHEEIAKELGIGVGTSKSNLNRARASLMRTLMERDPSLFAQRTDHGDH